MESLVVTTGEEHFPDRKRRPRAVDDIESSLSHLILNETSKAETDKPTTAAPQRLLYKRVRTTEPDGSRKYRDGVEHFKIAAGSSGSGGAEKATATRGDAAEPPSRLASDYLEVRRVRAKTIPSSVQGEGRKDPSSTDGSSGGYHVIDLQPVNRGEGVCGTRTRRGSEEGKAKRASAAPVLNPLERQMDEAIFTVS